MARSGKPQRRDPGNANQGRKRRQRKENKSFEEASATKGFEQWKETGEVPEWVLAGPRIMQTRQDIAQIAYDVLEREQRRDRISRNDSRGRRSDGRKR